MTHRPSINNPVKKRPHLLVTAGPTREMIDPVRFLSNLSTGEMGYQIAQEAVRKGFRVTLVSGPVELKRPKAVRFISVVTAGDMERAVCRHFRRCDILIMTAAVCDYTPLRRRAQKIKRVEHRHIAFKQTKDILKSVASAKGRRYVAGFCLETDHLEQNAVKKLKGKNLDLIAAARYGKYQNPFGRNRTSMLLIDRCLQKHYLRRCRKSEIARQLLSLISRNIIENGLHFKGK